MTKDIVVIRDKGAEVTVFYEKENTRKTHLLQDVEQCFLELQPDRNVTYILAGNLYRNICEIYKDFNYCSRIKPIDKVSQPSLEEKEEFCKLLKIEKVEE